MKFSIKRSLLLLFFLISCQKSDKCIDIENEFFKNLEKQVLTPRTPFYDTMTDLGKLKQEYYELFQKYTYLKRMYVSDSAVASRTERFLKLLKNPDLFDGDTVPCGAPLTRLGHRIGTPLHLKGIIDKKFRGASSTSDYFVQYVNGMKLPEPVSIRFKKEWGRLSEINNLKDKTIVELFGYESGCYVGSPPGLSLGRQIPWQFWEEFNVLEVILIDSSSAS